ncbi:hypothetical protein PST407_03883 [Pseudomonas syringae pv. tomato]|nr:hypothetical protein PSTA9_04370 [Pseudomonas syringae pv. tomato]KUR45482.1 hypothetical protein PST407_03883 [Pseudomonas syringae pv. tomato]
MLSSPLPILNTPAADFSASNPPPIEAMASTTGLEVSESDVNSLAVAVIPFATASVTGRIASPMLRIESLTAWNVSAQICDDVPLRSARFLSRIPEAF